MKCPSENMRHGHPGRDFMGRKPMLRRAFTLVESMAAIALLAFICAGTWLVLEHCTASAADLTQRMRAFEIARDNMEKLLGADSVQETTEYGTSEKFPDIRWQTTIESFYEPITSNMWVRGVCSAEYIDSSGTPQTVELVNWITGLSSEQTKQLTDRLEKQKKLLAKHLLETEELAAEFAGVNTQTIQQWVKNGMPMTDDGQYLKPWLDLYLQTDGKPTEQDKQTLLARYPELAAARPKKTTQDTTATPQSQSQQDQEMPQTQSDSETDSSDQSDAILQKEIDDLMKQTP
jgi:type II secretory pathway pseudopilin PulG